VQLEEMVDDHELIDDELDDELEVLVLDLIEQTDLFLELVLQVELEQVQQLI